jgi:hypothetical protein
MYAVFRPLKVALSAILFLCGCNDERIDGPPDSYFVVKHIADGDKYVIRQKTLEIEAVCENSTFTTKNDHKIHATNCLTTMPVGEEIKVTKHLVDWLYADWKEGDINWQMQLRVQQQILKQGRLPSPIQPSVWAISIAIFLGTGVAVLFMFFIFSRKKQNQATLRDQRIERRIPAKGGLEISSLDEPLIREKALAENASHHGVRVVAKKPWRPNDHVLVRSPRWGQASRARIAYCKALPGDVFAIGLQFSSLVDNWLTCKSDMSNDQLPVHLYRK